MHLQLKEFSSLERARDFALACISLLPPKVHWRLVYELAELAKRENRIRLARKLFEGVCRMQPCSGQGWVEFAKLEEERGAFDAAARVLKVGLQCCGYNENLLFRAIRLEEKRGDPSGARALLAPLRDDRIDQVWRTVLEGAALEVRAGNFPAARRVYKYLMAHVGWYGPIYHEACRLEERCGRYAQARAIVSRGLREVSRYGPLWFDAFRLSERLDMEDGAHLIAQGARPPMARVEETVSQALRQITKELVWKVHYERAQIEDRVAGAVARAAGGAGGGALGVCRREYALAAASCPPNLRWKVWLAGARTELGVGRDACARRLVMRSMREIPPKARYMAWLEMSRIEEFVGNVGVAREVLSAARREAVTEWKIFLESVMLELRTGHIAEATLQAETALEVHRGTGRLWAALITLRAADGVGAQAAVFRRALREVPKSGEVWAEGARLHLNPLSPLFDPEMAARFLEFAILFTPQYGDSFLELIRLRLVLRLLLPRARRLYGGAGGGAPAAAGEPVSEEAFAAVDVSDIELRCGNAGPNYGFLWFHCRGPSAGGVPTDTVGKALAMMAKELRKTQGVYVAALLRWLQVRSDALRYAERDGVAVTQIGDGAAGGGDAGLEGMLAALTRVTCDADATHGWRGRALPAHGREFAACIRKAQRNRPSVSGEQIQLTLEDFSLGMVGLSRLMSRVFTLESEQRLRYLFGTDQINV